MVNITHPELKETKTPSLPPAELETLKKMREDMCSMSASKDFKLQTQQRFLRRVLGPDSNTRNLLMVHGTGSGKTCTAIQIAEEYIIRPEFQNKRVLVIANPSVQDNFEDQIFDVSRVNVDPDGLLLSKQCTGRRYLEILERAQSEPLRLTDRDSKNKVKTLAKRVFNEFYEFQGYQGLVYYMDNFRKNKSDNDYKQWIRDTFNDRLIIIDEAHNLRAEVTESDINKLFAIKINEIIKNASGITLVLLTATPMFDNFDEIIYYFNLFLWNDRRLDLDKTITVSDIFEKNGAFKEGQEARFRGWCQDYISYIKGDNPFTFPFRLPPPDDLIAVADRKTDHMGNKIVKPRKYLTLTQSFVAPLQEEAIKRAPMRLADETSIICVTPDYKPLNEIFQRVEGQLVYRKDVEQFLAPSKIGLYSSKFALIMDIISKSNGVVFVYSNVVEYGANLFAMCLEEHGYSNAISENLLKSTSNEIAKGSKGKYALFTGQTSDADIKKTLTRLKDRNNADGSDIRVVIASRKVSEGVDFRFVRQIHVLDPWYNMSRIEQVLGRGMRTCSHSLLPFEHQNCTVYLHVCRYPKSTQECLDETVYRQYAEEKAINIARLKKVIMESAMDCPLQNSINNLPKDWRELTIPQVRSQDNKTLELKLVDMSAPSFEDTVTDLVCRIEVPAEDTKHERPLSAILDVRDEIFDKLLKLFITKPIWSTKDLYSHSSMKQYSKDVLDYIIQNAIESRFGLKDRNGRKGVLQSKDGVLALTFDDNDTLVDRLIETKEGSVVALPEKAVEETTEEPVTDVNVTTKREAYEWPSFANNFDSEILDWYIVDHVLKPEERIVHLLNLDWDDPPIYAKDLLAKMRDGKNMYILGSDQIYNHDKKLIVPIGEEKDVYTEWVTTAKNRFIENRDMLFASMKKDAIVFNLDEKSTEIRKAPRSKVIGGRACTSYTEAVRNAFSEWLSGDAPPEDVKTKLDSCMYLDLLVRQAVTSGKEGIFWVTPQELEIFNEDDNRKDLLKRLK